MNVVQRALSLIKERRNNILKGHINTIPITLKRTSYRGMPGLEKETYYLITAQTKGAKTQFTSFLFMFTPILYALEHNIVVKILYVPLEETPEKVLCRFMSYVLYTKYGIEVDYRTLMSSHNVALPEDILTILESEDMAKYLNKFNECVTFIEDTNPTGIYNRCREYADSIGTTHYKTITAKDELGMPKEVKVFDYYTLNNKNSYTYIILDHISLLSYERGFNLKQSIDKMSEYFVILRNRYKMSPVVVQQQNDNEGTDNIKINFTRPTLTGLRDSKNTAKDCNIAIGIHNPLKYMEAACMGYNITILKDNFRLIMFLASRDGEAGTSIGLYFNGKCSEFKELPKPDTPEMNEKYNEIIKAREEKDSNKVADHNKPMFLNFMRFMR